MKVPRKNWSSKERNRPPHLIQTQPKQSTNSTHKFNRSQSLTYENPSLEIWVNTSKNALKNIDQPPKKLILPNKSKIRPNEVKSSKVNIDQNSSKQKVNASLNISASLSFAPMNSDLQYQS